MSTPIIYNSSEYTFQWMVTISKDCNELKEINTYSPSFTNMNDTWNLLLQFGQDSVSLYLNAVKLSSDRTVRFYLWVCQDESLLNYNHFVCKFRTNDAYGKANMIKRPLEATTYTFGVKILAPSNIPTSPACLDSLSTIFNDPETSDIEFHIQDRCIYAHKAILIARSSYFNEKFKEGFDGVITTKDSQRQCIEISEDYEAFQLLLYHLYTGCSSMPSITVETKKVLEISSKYEAEELLLAMEENVIRQLSEENVSEILFDYGYKYDDLKIGCTEFIKDNYETMRDMEDFKKQLREFAEIGGNGNFLEELFFSINN